VRLGRAGQRRYIASAGCCPSSSDVS